MYHYIKNGNIIGPFNEDAIVKKFMSGDIDKSMMIKKKGAGSWNYVKDETWIMEKMDEIKNNPRAILRSTKTPLVNKILVYSIVVALAISFCGYLVYNKIQEGIGSERRKAEALEYGNFVSGITGKLVKMASLSEIVVDDINKEWRDAIFSGNKKKDFNEAIMEVSRKRADEIQVIEKCVMEIKLMITEFELPDSKSDEGKRIREIYLTFVKYADMATDPSGSLQTYSERNSQLTMEVASLARELELMGATK